MLRNDLKRARKAWIDAAQTEVDRKARRESDFLVYEDTAGLIADFHSTRHTYISNVVAGGASVKVAQELARHSTCRLTIDRYSHTRLHDLQSAVDTLPAFDVPEDRQAIATGTHGPNDLGQKQAQQEAQQLGRETVLFGAESCVNEIVETAKENPTTESEGEASCEVMRDDARENEKGAGGSRTHDGGFAIRCLSLLATAPVGCVCGKYPRHVAD